MRTYPTLSPEPLQIAEVSFDILEAISDGFYTS